MTFDAKQVFLVSGQSLLPQQGGDELWSSTIEQLVVVADDAQAAYAIVEGMVPKFKPVGLASLDDYERALSKIKNTLTGADTGCRLIVAPNLSA